mmetsp:Transcript_81839/g.132749  ORF Transcript_81839/g.132749 Transcript_81839/m.132749 type:complete len:218 (-) Transcript_81839:285-938(-)
MPAPLHLYARRGGKATARALDLGAAVTKGPVNIGGRLTPEIAMLHRVSRLTSVAKAIGAAHLREIAVHLLAHRFGYVRLTFVVFLFVEVENSALGGNALRHFKYVLCQCVAPLVVALTHSHVRDGRRRCVRSCVGRGVGIVREHHGSHAVQHTAMHSVHGLRLPLGLKLAAHLHSHLALQCLHLCHRDFQDLRNLTRRMSDHCIEKAIFSSACVRFL